MLTHRGLKLPRVCAQRAGWRGKMSDFQKVCVTDFCRLAPYPLPIWFEKYNFVPLRMLRYDQAPTAEGRGQS